MTAPAAAAAAIAPATSYRFRSRCTGPPNRRLDFQVIAQTTKSRKSGEKNFFGEICAIILAKDQARGISLGKGGS
jgi:hypothetical protein